MYHSHHRRGISLCLAAATVINAAFGVVINTRNTATDIKTFQWSTASLKLKKKQECLEAADQEIMNFSDYSK